MLILMLDVGGLDGENVGFPGLKSLPVCDYSRVWKIEFSFSESSTVAW